MQDLRVTIVQFNPVWEDKEANLQTVDSLLKQADHSHVFLLPEMFTTGFSMNVEKLSETMKGPTIGWMSARASDYGAVISGSLVIFENGKYFNRMVWANPNGEIHWYDKRHLFSPGEEHNFYEPGNQRVTLTWNGWKFRLLVCYDLRFPVWSRNDDEYDVLIVSANWPSARHQVWKSLLMARALENQCYCIGINRIGNDGTGLQYLGDSGLISPRGEADWMGRKIKAETFFLSYNKLHEFREKFPILRDRDHFSILP